jgi:hypothetical protein
VGTGTARPVRLLLETLEDRSLPSVTTVVPPFPGAITTAVVALPPQPPPLSNPSPLAGVAFVDTLYADLLGRHAEQAGLNSWLGVLQTRGQAAVVQGILGSPEYRGLEVTNYYQTFLGRTPSAAEVAGWVSVFQAGATEQQVIVDFVTSPEFQALHPSNDSFVTALYQDVLGHAPSPDAQAAWVNQLNMGESRAQVALTILNSSEDQGDVVSAYYDAFLHRIPSSMEVAGWLNFLAASNDRLDAVAVGILTSTEFHQDLSTGQR